MQHEPRMDRHLAALRRRVRLLVAERTALLAGAGAAALGLALVALDKFRLLRVEWFYLGAFVAAAVACGFVVGLLRRVSDFDVARAAEDRLALKERLSSAVALEPLADHDPMVTALVEDAAGRLTPVRPARLFPHRFDRRGQAFLGLVILLVAAIVLPELSMFQSPAARLDRAALRRHGEKLVKVSRDLEKRQVPDDTKKILRQIALNLKALGKDMKRARVTRKQALVRLNKIEKQLQLAKTKMGASQEKSLAQAATEMKAGQAALAEARLAERKKLLERLEAARLAKMGQAPEDQQLTDEQMKALQKLAQSLKTSQAQQLLALDADLAAVLADLLAKDDMQEALKILQRLADKLSDPETLKSLTPEERKRLAEEMRRLAEALKGTDLDALAKDLLELAKALERGDLKKCEKCGKCLGLGCAGMLGLGAACDGTSACLAGLGKGVGPDMGLGRYDPNRPHDVNRQDPTRIPTKHFDTHIPGQLGDRGDAHAIQVLGAPDQAGESQVPYYRVYSDYSKAAEHALDREDIPGPYKDRVKTYFESLKPESE